MDNQEYEPQPVRWPLPNVWLGCSTENQEQADKRIPHLLKCPAAVRFLSVEPMLGPINLQRIPQAVGFVDALDGRGHDGSPTGGRDFKDDSAGTSIEWVIVGGESGRGARPCDLAWIRSIIAQCKAASVSCFVKQLGANPEEWDATKRKAGHGPYIGNTMRDSHGGNWEEWPEDLRVREFPAAGVRA